MKSVWESSRSPVRDAEAESDWSYPLDGAEVDLAPVIGRNLRRFRQQRGLSLERLARLSGVSRAMLGQVELGQSAPSVNVLWRVARALGLSLSAFVATAGASGPRLLRAQDAKRLISPNGAYVSRALFPFDEARSVEFYELRLAARSTESAEPHPPGTVENLVVTVGTVDIDVAGEAHHLGPGDAVLFDADVPHAYRNTGAQEAVMFVVMTYAGLPG